MLQGVLGPCPPPMQRGTDASHRVATQFPASPRCFLGLCPPNPLNWACPQANGVPPGAWRWGQQRPGGGISATELGTPGLTWHPSAASNGAPHPKKHSVATPQNPGDVTPSRVIPCDRL